MVIWTRVRLGCERGGNWGVGGRTARMTRARNTQICTYQLVRVYSYLCMYVLTIFRPIFRSMFRNKITFEEWSPNTKYVLGNLGSYRNKITFLYKR